MNPGLIKIQFPPADQFSLSVDTGQQLVTPASPGAAASAQPAVPVQSPAAAQSPPVAANDQTSWISQLSKLAQLRDQGVLSDAAFAAAKQSILEHTRQPQPPGPAASLPTPPPVS
jgi:hypothetical protein